MINYWHSILDMPKRDFEWHKADVSDELIEFKEAKGLMNKWSELSDVVYTYTRARWSGHKTIKYPLGKISFVVGLLYMFPKYTLRWRFYRVLGKKIGKNVKITEVRNPKKIEKLKVIALKYNLDPEELAEEAEQLMKRWFFLK
ncbi:MAG: hypothetical protein NTZ87_00650 [Candidatus Nomurabacteria bacterium]|nr:hypothetical protein [Candidatus Nomurabacteria bacterium]